MTHSSLPPGYPSRNQGESEQAYLKRLPFCLPDPESLPERYEDYFLLDGAEFLPLELLISSKTDGENATSGRNAAKLMAAAREGVVSKRSPIRVRQGSSGRFIIVDGNATVAAARAWGWELIPAEVERD